MLTITSLPSYAPRLRGSLKKIHCLFKCDVIHALVFEKRGISRFLLVILMPDLNYRAKLSKANYHLLSCLRVFAEHALAALSLRCFGSVLYSFMKWLVKSDSIFVQTNFPPAISSNSSSTFAVKLKSIMSLKLFIRKSFTSIPMSVETASPSPLRYFRI